MSNITTKAVRDIMSGKPMTAGHIANAGGWQFDDVVQFFSKHATCEVESCGFERHVMAGVGVTYKWIEYDPSKKSEKSAARRNYERCADDLKKRCAMVLSLLSDPNNQVLQIECRRFGWNDGHTLSTVRSLISDGLIESFGRKGHYAVYRLTDKWRDAVCNSEVLEVA